MNRTHLLVNVLEGLLDKILLANIALPCLALDIMFFAELSSYIFSIFSRSLQEGSFT